ncbi:conserved hypothetical protein [Agrobacterium fabacearum S56]|uniref:hypothetical protein n=1 Tax=Agrobacterium TaxID=357 RepID=UPI00037EA93B|nr:MULTISPECIES: hypothetical protein [Agrobacterium]CUX04291.1 conserved hypothetical protein [Agrobacterium fabacearum S56]
MDPIEQNLVNWKESLFASIPVGGLLSRNSVVYKWKAAFRIWMLREAIFWRLSDLMTQSYALHKQGHGLGARILLRSGFETLATLIYLNQLMQDVLEAKLNFHTFGEKTAVLLLGSRNNADMPYSLNIVTVLNKCDKRYPGIMALYADLSESSHPSYEGLCMGYSKIDHEEYETHFSNRWMEIFGSRHLGSMELCMETFHHEYNDVWPCLIEKLEGWIEANDAELEATKNSKDVP